jgi:hypothetical protein
MVIISERLLKSDDLGKLEWLLPKCKSRTSIRNFDSAAWVAPTGIEPVSKV